MSLVLSGSNVPACSSCTKPYTAESLPRMIGCGQYHSCCFNCLYRHWDGHNTGTCPICAVCFTLTDPAKAPLNADCAKLFMYQKDKTEDREAIMSICTECKTKTTDDMMRICLTCTRMDNKKCNDQEFMISDDNKIEKLAICLDCVMKRHGSSWAHKIIEYLGLKAKREASKLRNEFKVLGISSSEIALQLNDASKDLNSILTEFSNMSEYAENAESCDVICQVRREMADQCKAIEKANNLLKEKVNSYRVGVQSCTNLFKERMVEFQRRCKRVEEKDIDMKQWWTDLFFTSVFKLNEGIAFIIVFFVTIIRVLWYKLPYSSE